MKQNQPQTNGSETMRLEYQTAAGTWIDCGERTEQFLGDCEEFSGQDRAGVLADLAAGKKVRNDPSDWYSNCRDGEVAEARTARRVASPPAMKKCSCGHTVRVDQVMSASMGSSCCDCYDRMAM